MNIKNLNKRQFNTTLNKEKVIVTDYYDNTKYAIFIRKMQRSTSPKSHIRIFYSQDTDINVGTIFVMNKNTYLVLSQDADESNIYYTSSAVKCDTRYTTTVNQKKVSVPFYVVNDKWTVSHGSTFSAVNGTVIMCTGYNDFVKDKIKVNGRYYGFGNYYKIGNRFINDGICYIYMEQQAMPQELDESAATDEIGYIPPNSGGSSGGSGSGGSSGGSGSGGSSGGSSDGSDSKEFDSNTMIASLYYKYEDNQIHIGGSYKTIAFNFYDRITGKDITDSIINGLSDDDFVWSCFVDSVEYTNNTNVVKWHHRIGTDPVNQMRVKILETREADNLVTNKLTVRGKVKNTLTRQIYFTIAYIT